MWCMHWGCGCGCGPRRCHPSGITDQYSRETIETPDSCCSSGYLRPLPGPGLVALSCLGLVFNRPSCSDTSQLYRSSWALSQEVLDDCLGFLQTLFKTGWGCEDSEWSKHGAGNICSDFVETLGWCPLGVLSRLDVIKIWVVHAVSQAGFLPVLLIRSDQATSHKAWFISHCI